MRPGGSRPYVQYRGDQSLLWYRPGTCGCIGASGRSRGFEVVAAANPLRSVAGDAAYVRDVIRGIGTPVVLAGHSYGGIVITEAAAHNSAVVGLVYVNGFAPDHGESAFQLSTMFPGSTLADATP